MDASSRPLLPKDRAGWRAISEECVSRRFRCPCGRVDGPSERWLDGSLTKQSVNVALHVPDVRNIDLREEELLLELMTTLLLVGAWSSAA